jgi:hypothetical protein
VSEAALFASTLATIRAGFELRKPDAWDNALRLRDKYARAGLALGEIAGTTDAVDRARESIMRAQAIDRLMVEFQHANLLQERGRFGPTPEATLRPGRDNSIAALVKAGHLDKGQESAAAQVAEVVEAITASLHARGGTDMRSTGGAKVGDFLPVRLSDWYSYRYLPWVGAMFDNLKPDLQPATDGKQHQHLKLVFTVVVDGISLDTAVRPLGMGWRRGLRLLSNGLELYHRIAELEDSSGLVMWRLRDRALNARLDRRRKA